MAPTNYSRILKQFTKKYPRATRIFYQLYNADESTALRFLRERDWKRWYLFKVCVKHIKRDLRSTEPWVADHLSPEGLQMLSRSVKKMLAAVYNISISSKK